MFTALVLLTPYLLSGNDEISYDVTCAVGVHAAINEIEQMIKLRDPPLTPSKMKSSITGLYCEAVSRGSEKQVVVEVNGFNVDFVIARVGVSDFSVTISYDRKCDPFENPTCLD